MLKQANSFFSASENTLWISAGGALSLSVFVDRNIGIVFLFWLVVMLFANNAKRLYSEQEGLPMLFARRSLYVAPLLLPLFWYRVLNELSALPFLLGLLVAAVFFFINRKAIRIQVSYDFLREMRVQPLGLCVANVFSPLSAAFVEELFFRGFVITFLLPIVGIWSILISAFLFFLHHYGVKWYKDFSRKDLMTFLFFGLSVSAIYYHFHSIWACIFTHLLFNSPLIVSSSMKGIISVRSGGKAVVLR